MVSHPETGSDPPIWSDRESGRDTMTRDNLDTSIIAHDRNLIIMITS